MITIEVNDQHVTALLDALARRASDLKPAMRTIGEYLVESTKRRFAAGVDPEGDRWAPNRPVTIARYLARFKSSHTKTGALSAAGRKRSGAKKPLVGESKSLSTTIHYRADRTSVAVGSPMEYAAVHQFGAHRGAFGKTRRGAPIPWGDIPARPFLGLSDEDRGRIAAALQRYMTAERS